MAFRVVSICFRPTYIDETSQKRHVHPGTRMTNKNQTVIPYALCRWPQSILRKVMNGNVEGYKEILPQVHIDGLLDQNTNETRMDRPISSDLHRGETSYVVEKSNQGEVHETQGSSQSPQTTVCNLEWPLSAHLGSVHESLWPVNFL